MESKDSEREKPHTTGPGENTDPNIIGEPKTSPTPTGQSSKPTLRVSRYFKGQLPADHPLRKGYFLMQPLTKGSADSPGPQSKDKNESISASTSLGDGI